MLDLAKHIVTQKAATFDPEKFEDHYEEALTELINAKRNGKTVSAKRRPKGENLVDLMDALKKSIAGEVGSLPVRRRCFSRSRERSRQLRRRPSPNALPGAGRLDNLGGAKSVPQRKSPKPELSVSS
jgi:hypothetical protein